MESQLTPERILSMGMGFMNSKTILSAVELGIFTELAKAPLKAEQLEKRLGLHPRSARDFFDALVSLGFLTRGDDGLYGNSPDVDLFLDRAKPNYMGGLLEMANERLYGFWGALTTGLKTGQPQNEASKGGNPFDAIYATPEKASAFMKAMTGISMGAAIAIAQKFPWNTYQTFIDIGTAQGGLPVQVALANKHLTGGGFDLPIVRPTFESYVEANGLSDRLRFYEGNMFEEPLPGADVLVMGHILHDWNLEEKRLILKKAYDALPQGGALIVYEALIDDDRRTNAFGLLMSLNMLIETPGGFDYTGADCSGWMRDAGFRETRVEHLAGPDSMVIGVK